MKAFRISLGPRSAPRLSFEAMAESSMDAAMAHLALAQPGECMRVDVIADDLTRAVHQRQSARESLLTSNIN